MKAILSLLFVSIFSFCSFSQSNFKVGQEINYFDGLNWVESEIVKIENGKYFVYTNREKTKTKWVSSDDFEALYTEVVMNSQLKINKTESLEIPILQIGDSVLYNNGSVWLTSQIQNIDENRICTLQLDSLNTIKRSEEELTLLSSASEPKFKIIEKKTTILFSVGDKVQYTENGMLKIGEIVNINDEDQLKINDKWINYTLVEKVKK